jgi:hypothetical protein
MGTRADFYEKKKGAELVWLGSIAFDGYPDGIDPKVLKAKHSHGYKRCLKKFFEDDREDVTLPEQGWPWPWDTSEITDCAYCFNGKRVVAYSKDGNWCRPVEWDEDEKGPQPIIWRHPLPNMASKKNVTMGKRSGLIIISAYAPPL